MKPRISVITLGVADLDRSLAFYRDAMGLEAEGVVGADIEGYAVVFFRLEVGLVLALWPGSDLARDANVPRQPVNSSAFSLGHNVRTREEVDAVIEQARAAGAEITDLPKKRPWGGYSGYFRNPDGHLWDVVCNPELLPEM